MIVVPIFTSTTNENLASPKVPGCNLGLNLEATNAFLPKAQAPVNSSKQLEGTSYEPGVHIDAETPPTTESFPTIVVVWRRVALKRSNGYGHKDW